MSKVSVSKICNCFKKSELQATSIFNSNKEALEHALKSKDYMNNNFCSKHKFELIKIFDNYIISTVIPKEKSLKCCGLGCCSKVSKTSFKPID